MKIVPITSIYIRAHAPNELIERLVYQAAFALTFLCLLPHSLSLSAAAAAAAAQYAKLTNQSKHVFGEENDEEAEAVCVCVCVGVCVCVCGL